VYLVRGSAAETISEHQKLALRGGTEEILSSCNLNSMAHGSWVQWPPDLSREWNRGLVGDHVLVRYASSARFETFGGMVEVRELLLPLGPGQMPGQPLTRTPHTVIGYEKCSGTLMIEFSCSEPVEPLMPASYSAYCELYRAAQSAPDES